MYKIVKRDQTRTFLKFNLRKFTTDDAEFKSKRDSTSKSGGELQKFSLQVHCCTSICGNSCPHISFLLYDSSHLNSKPNPVAYLKIKNFTMEIKICHNPILLSTNTKKIRFNGTLYSIFLPP